MISLDQSQYSPGCVPIQIGEPVQTYDQYYRYAVGEWVLGSFFTSDNMKANDKVPYQRPVTFSAKAKLFPAIIRKYWRLKFLPWLKKKFNK